MTTPTAIMDTVASGPITDDERTTIIELLEQGMSHAQVAREVGRSTGSVANVAKAHGVRADQSALARVVRANEARSAFCAERRAVIAAKLTEEADRLLGEMHDPYLVFNFGGKDNTYEEHQLDEPPTEAKFTMVRTVGQAMKTVLDIDRQDNRADEGAAAVDEWLRSRLAAGEG